MKDIVTADEPITLGTLLSVKGAPSYLQKQIQTHSLALPADRIHLIPSRYIREIISAYTDQSVIIIGKRTAFIPGEYSKNWSNEFIHQFVDFLMSNLCKKNNRVEVELPLFWPFHDSRQQGEFLFHIQNRREYMGFPVGEIGAYMINRAYDESEKKLFSLVVHQYIPMLKAAAPLERNEVLSWEKLIVREGKLNPFMGEVLQEDEPIGVFQTTKKVAPGDLIYKSSIKKILHVRAGEKVTIVIKKGTILLSMTGRAADSGGVGDSVKVRPSQSTEWIIGMVTGRREVLIEM